MSPHRALTLAAAASVNESARSIPVAHRVDVLVVGGSTGAVQAAVEAAETGARVFLAAPYPYLGEDMTATLRLWPQPEDELDSPLVQRLFDDPRAAERGKDKGAPPPSSAAGTAAAPSSPHPPSTRAANPSKAS